MKCKKCGTRLQSGYEFCTSCGARIDFTVNETKPDRKNRFLTWVLIIAAVILAVMTAMVFTPLGDIFTNRNGHDASADHPAPEAIELTEERPAETNTPEPEPTPSSAPQESAPKVTMDAVRDVTATSVLAAIDSFRYDPPLTVDGKLETAWVEGKDGQGEGESITLVLDSAYAVSGIYIHSGYQKSSDLFQKNSRPEMIRVEFSDGTSQSFRLDDAQGMQTLTFSAPVTTTFVTIAVEAVYAGSVYQDTAISEIQLF